jgi:hypothetical protein
LGGLETTHNVLWAALYPQQLTPNFIVD